MPGAFRIYKMSVFSCFSNILKVALKQSTNLFGKFTDYFITGQATG